MAARFTGTRRRSEHVVDQPGVTDAGRHGYERVAVDRSDGAGRSRARRLPGTQAPRQGLPFPPAPEPRTVAASRSPVPPRPWPPPRVATRPPGCAARARGRRCDWTSPGRRPLARWGTPRSLRGDIEVGYEPPDGKRLPDVLLAEVGDVGATMLKSFVTTVATPSKCSTPRRAPRALSDAPHAHRGGEPRGIYLLHWRREQHVDADACGQRRVARLVARVARGVLARPELRRVHEQRDDDVVTEETGSPWRSAESIRGWAARTPGG